MIDDNYDLRKCLEVHKEHKHDNNCFVNGGGNDDLML